MIHSEHQGVGKPVFIAGLNKMKTKRPMREIKFKFWHKEWGKWLLNCGLTDDGVIWDFTTDSEIKNVIPVQFTGLKDKNGKEIYEGDVVLHEFSTDVPLEVKIGGYMGVRNGESCNEAGYGVFAVDKDERWVIGLGCFDFDKQAEVIGNIFENKELLDL